jgi:hypothetical protein
MSYDTAKYREILANHQQFEDTTDWLPRDHVPEWMRIDRKMTTGFRGVTSFLKAEEKGHRSLSSTAIILGVGNKRLIELYNQYGWGSVTRRAATRTKDSVSYRFKEMHIAKYRELLGVPDDL